MRTGVVLFVQNPVRAEEFEYAIDDDFDEEEGDDMDSMNGMDGMEHGLLGDHKDTDHKGSDDGLVGLVGRKTAREWGDQRYQKQQPVGAMSDDDSDDDSGDDDQSQSDLEGGDAMQLLIPRNRRIVINVPNAEPGATDKIYLRKFSRYCQHCATIKPPRSHHCHICNRCILRYDHILFPFPFQDVTCCILSLSFSLPMDAKLP
jgi:hypothetical protein